MTVILFEISQICSSKDQVHNNETAVY